jgi:hypothetical protein
LTRAQNAREDKGPESPCVGAQAAPAALEEAVAAERPGVWGSGQVAVGRAGRHLRGDSPLPARIVGRTGGEGTLRIETAGVAACERCLERR